MKRSGKRFRLAALLTAVSLMTGCTASTLETPEEALPTLAPAAVGWTAPDGDRMEGDEGLWTLYLPGKNGLNLVAQHIPGTPGLLRTERLEQMCRELLSFQANSQVDALRTESPLELAGTNPVEFSSGVATVNLSSPALGLSYRQFYIMSLALAATLCEEESVHCVNVLVEGRCPGLDAAGTLTMGSLIAYPGGNLPVLWEQMEARRTPVGQDAAATPLTAYMTLYYPLENGEGIGCENRTLTFPGQTPRQMAESILEALSHDAMYLPAAQEMPNLPSLLAYEPLTSELADGGRMITLTFREEMTETLAEMGVDEACLTAALCYTMTTFIPGPTGVAIRIGDRPLTAVSSEKFGTISVPGGLFRREMFESFLMGQIPVYFTREDMLVPIEKSIARELADSPRAQLASLLEGPGEPERAEGLEPTLPEGVGEEDILGIALEGDTLLVNLSESFRDEIQSWGRDRETLLCYSMVNTLCDNTGARQVCFFFEGVQVEYICGSIYWAGVFNENSGLAEESFG